MWAAEKGHADVCAVLIAQGAHLDAGMQPAGHTALYMVGLDDQCPLQSARSTADMLLRASADGTLSSCLVPRPSFLVPPPSSPSDAPSGCPPSFAACLSASLVHATGNWADTTLRNQFGATAAEYHRKYDQMAKGRCEPAASMLPPACLQPPLTPLSPISPASPFLTPE